MCVCLNSHYLMKPILMNSHSSCMKDIESEVPVLLFGQTSGKEGEKIQGKKGERMEVRQNVNGSGCK